ncbi:MAG: hypothetical protein MUO63_03845 [Desulfobulbaceae bacterium]|nr:hypothetical protein [Desulfobulbaceae bacterium]
MEEEMETQHLEKRFGVIAIESGYVTPNEFVDALKIQVLEDIEKGQHRLIGRILLEQGVMNLEQIDRVLGKLGKGMPLLKESV